LAAAVVRRAELIDADPGPGLPLERFPGAVLRRVSRPGDNDVVSSTDLQRSYVVEGADMESVADHYTRQLQRIGAKGVQRAKGFVFWSGEPIAKVVKVSVSQGALAIAEGSGLSLHDLLDAMPDIHERIPNDLLAFEVSIYWSEPSDRVAFLTPTDQERFEVSKRAKEEGAAASAAFIADRPPPGFS
jgi:hypothetical protein